MGNFLNSALAFIEKHPILFALIGAIFGSILTIIGFFFRQIKSFITNSSKWLWRKLQGRGKDHDFEKAYLNWLIRENRHLGLLPAQLVARHWKDRQKLADLEKVYVNLSISTQSGDEHWGKTYGNGESTWRKQPWIGWRVIIWLAQHLLLARFSLDIPLLPEQTYQPGDLGLVVDRHKRLIIRGDPGSGKTTLLKYLTVTCARSLRNNRGDGDSAKDVKKRLLWTQRPFPILVRLRRYGDVTHWDEAKELTAAILGEMRPELRKQCPPGFFEQRLRKGNCLILLDAFDELGTPEARAAMAGKIAGFLEIYPSNENRIVVTTRIVGYEDQLDRYGFTVRTVHNLQAGEIRALVKQRYNAIAIAESALRPEQETRDIEQNMRERAERLIEKVESTPRLNQLATNPMLLSLIVLVHSLKIELPDERLLLYRDCVEILAESWQQFKREEAGIKKEVKDELSLNQKLILLRELAFAMQKQRKDEGSPALMPKDIARDIIAGKLPDFLAVVQNGLSSEEISRKADEWIAGIQEESGILVEQGLDEAGEPLIGFSHLTFQEYLAAIAIYEEKTYLPLFRRNLLQPAWQEVVLLYTALANDATPTINALLKLPLQPQGTLLAGRCLGERLKKKVNPRTQQLAIEKLKEGYANADDKNVGDFGQIMSMLRENEIITFLRQQLNNPSLQKQLAAILALGQTRTDAPEIEQVRSDLAQIVETSRENTITIAARETLSRIGDPRFSGPEPILVRVPAQPQKVPALMRTWKDLKTSPQWKSTKKFSQRRNMITRVIDHWLFTRWSATRRRQIYGYEFEIAKYPVTNIEYHRFIMATEHLSVPSSWKEGTFPHKEATHPVISITKKDAVAYCKWLSQKTGHKYRLPTQWEWEWAAASPQGWKYPWGDQFDKDRCNIEEANIEGTTPVGSYLAGNSLYGASDMIGNVWEINSGSLFSSLSLFLFSLFSFSLFLFSLFSFLFSFLLFSFFFSLRSFFFSLYALLFSFLLLFLFFFLPLYASLFSSYPINNSIARGGAWNSPSDEATCFYREGVTNTKSIGFRCLKELDPTIQQPPLQPQTV